MRELLRYLELWRGTRPFSRLASVVSVKATLVFDFVVCVFFHGFELELLLFALFGFGVLKYFFCSVRGARVVVIVFASADCFQSSDNLANRQSEERISSFVRRNRQVALYSFASIT